jgi:outer membrane lipoprotein-sorting protein
MLRGNGLRFGIWIFSGAWSLVLGALAFAPLNAAEPATALDKFLSAQTNLQSWSADLTQIRRLKTLIQPLTSTGRVWFVAPNKFRWEIGSPAQTIAVRGADEMLVIYPRLKRVEKYPLRGEAMGQWKDTLALLEAGFPRNRADIDQRFKIISVMPSNDVFNAILQPKSAAARRMMPQITISFAADNSRLSATELQFGDGATMRNEFRNAQLNPKLDDSLFTPKLEPDYKIVEPMKTGSR